MITLQEVFNGDTQRGFATINSDNNESFLITYMDYDLSLQIGIPIVITKIFKKGYPCGFQFGSKIETYE